MRVERWQGLTARVVGGADREGGGDGPGVEAFVDQAQRELDVKGEIPMSVLEGLAAFIGEHT